MTSITGNTNKEDPFAGVGKTQTSQTNGTDATQGTGKTPSPTKVNDRVESMQHQTSTMGVYLQNSFQPMLPTPGVTAGIKTHGAQQTANEAMRPALLQSGLKELQAMESSATKLADSFPQGSPQDLSIKEFIATIRTAIAQLKQLLTEISNADLKAKAKSGKEEVNVSKQREWTISEGVAKRQESRSKIEEMGKQKGAAKNGAIAMVIIFAVLAVVLFPSPLVLLFPIPALLLYGLPMLVLVVAPLVVGIVELAPGEHQGFMSRAGVAKLQDEKNKLDAEIAGTGDGVHPSRLKGSFKEPVDEAAIVDMINILTQMLAKIMMGSQLGQVDIQQMAKSLSGLKDPAIPEELKQRLNDINKKMGPVIDMGASGQNAPIQGAFKEALTALNLYNFYMEKGDLAGAKGALDSLDKAMYNYANEAAKTSFAKEPTLKEIIDRNTGASITGASMDVHDLLA